MPQNGSRPYPLLAVLVCQPSISRLNLSFPALSGLPQNFAFTYGTAPHNTPKCEKSHSSITGRTRVCSACYTYKYIFAVSSAK